MRYYGVLRYVRRGGRYSEYGVAGLARAGAGAAEEEVEEEEQHHKQVSSNAAITQ